jgi:hypothetical protein
MNFEEGEEVEDKGTGNMFNQIITEDFPNLEKEMAVQIQEASWTLDGQNIMSPLHDIL